MATQSQEAVQTDTANVRNATVGLADAELVPANPARVYMKLHNLGTVAVYIDNSTATVAGSFPIPAGGTFEDRDYTGAVRAISGTAAQDVRIWEVG